MQFTHKFSIQWVSVCLLLTAATISAQEINISHCLGSCPDVSRPTNEVTLHHVFAAAVIPETGEVEWVAYRVLPESVGVASLYVVTGPVVSRQSVGRDSESGRADAFFKVVSDGKRVAAFQFDANLPPHAHFCGQVSSLAEIEGQISLALFPDLELSDSSELVVALGYS